MEIKNTKEFAKLWIEEGRPCQYRRGLEFRGAKARAITKEDAERLLPQYSFGMGFYELLFTKNEGLIVLEFNELGENDLY
jgi:hypothetical protein